MIGYKVVLKTPEGKLQSLIVEIPKKYRLTYEPFKWTRKAYKSIGIFFFLPGSNRPSSDKRFFICSKAR